MQKTTVASWPLGSAGGNFPMALDEAHHRIFVGCRSPACLLVMDAQSGRELDRLNLHGDCDDLFFDPVRNQLYASCGEGFVDVFAQSAGDHYARKESVETAPRARTCFFSGSEIFVAVPRRGEQSAELLCYQINP